jgi:hypothetical protein
MTWSNVPGGPPHSAPSDPQAQQRAEWERGGSTLFPAGKLADRISTVLLLAFGLGLTVLAAVVAVIAVASATANCDARAGCTPGGFIGGGAIAGFGAFVLWAVTAVLAVAAWIRRRTSWWIAAIGFVLVVGCIVWGGVVFAGAADGGATSTSVTGTA